MKYEVHVTPRARKNAVTERDGVIKVLTTAVPDGGKANEAVIKLLAKYLDVPKSMIRIARGHSGRNKLIDVQE